MKPNPMASTFFRLACDAGLSESFRTLAPSLIQSQEISFEDAVTIVDRQGKTAHENLSLRQAFWTMALSESFEGGYEFKRRFFTTKGATFFQQACADFFTPGDDGESIFKTIVELSEVSENFPADFRTRYFRDERKNDEGGDAWLAQVIEQQAASSFFTKNAEQAWAALLRMGSEQGILAFLKKRPNAWSIEDAKGKPVLKALATTLKQEVWNVFLESGQNPLSALGNKPVWRALLPVAPVGVANRGSLRDGVENWLREQHRQGRLDEEGERYVCTISFNEIFPRTSNGQQMTLTAVKQLLEKTPARWVLATPENKKLPAFMVFLGSSAKNKDGKPVAAGGKWVEAFTDNKDWSEALGPSGREIVQIAAAVLANQENQLPVRLQKETVDNRHLSDFILKLCDLTKRPSEAWLRWVKAQNLEHTLAHTPESNARKSPRL